MFFFCPVKTELAFPNEQDTENSAMLVAMTLRYLTRVLLPEANPLACINNFN